jgi:DNA-binding transcriptional regulator GbsR (MarR family)
MLFRVQKDKANPYVMMNKSFFQDVELSAKAKGILGYILTLPDDWQIYLEEITTHFKDGIKSISNGVKELIERGYIVRETVRNEKGYYKGCIYDVYEVRTETPKTEIRKTENRKQPTTNKELNKVITKLNNKHTEQKAEEIKTLCVDAENILHEKISPSRMQELVKNNSIAKIKDYLARWDKFKHNAKQSQSSYFIYCIENDLQEPKQFKPTVNKDYSNFEQREYEEADYEKFYANLREVRK